jgi:uncharacterized membrane protein
MSLSVVVSTFLTVFCASTEEFDLASGAPYHSRRVRTKQTETRIREWIEQDRPRNRTERFLKGVTLLAPLAVAVAVPVFIWMVLDFESVRRFVANAALSILFFGKFIIVRGIGDGGYTPYEYALLVLYLDLLVAFFLTYNLDYAYRIPYLGQRLEGLQDYGREVVEERPWVRKVTFLGVILFVMFPLTGTGAVGGSLFGRLLGLTRIRTLTGIFVGSFTGCALMAVLAEGIATLLPQEVRTSIWFEIIGLSVLVLLVAFLWWRAAKIEKARKSRGGTPD